MEYNIFLLNYSPCIFLLNYSVSFIKFHKYSVLLLVFVSNTVIQLLL